jgi:hypothetical protein
VANRLTAPLLVRTPERGQPRLAALQRPGVPLLGPTPPSVRSPKRLLDAGPLYAGECISQIQAVQPAGKIVRDLSP